MQKARLVKKVLGERFAKHGFEFMGSVDRGVWEFKKTLDNVIEQTITILLDRFESNEVYFILNSKFGNNVKACDFVPEPEYANKQWWEFNDDDEFVKALEEMGYLIEKYGFKKLDELSVSPYKFEATEEMNRRVYEKHDELTASFMKKYGIEDDITLWESIEIIKGIVEETDERIYDEKAKERLIGLAAFYGEQLIKKYDGEWEWCKHNSMCRVVKMKNLMTSMYVLSRISQAWEKSSAEIIIESYIKMVENEKYGYYNGKKFVNQKL